MSLVHSAEDNVRLLCEELARVGSTPLLRAVVAGAIVHEVSQPLTAISTNAQVALRMLASGAELSLIEPVLQDIALDSTRANDVVRRTRALLKAGAIERQRLDVNAVVDEVVQAMEPTAVDRSVRLERQLTATPPDVFADRVQIQQVVLNLLLNAFDAVGEVAPARRRVTVSTGRTASGVNVSVRDSGCGATDEQLARMFEPMYTTKAEGMGLGLAICDAIIAAYGGSIRADRNPDEGLTVSAIVPA
jgi:two-component system sensor kinase FixL